MKKSNVSLKDIAKKVGVSTATVSYVLSKDKSSKISEAVSEKVKKAAKELNYQPNQIAKSLKMGKTFTIGLIVADISNPFFAHIARIIEDEAAKLDYTVIFGSSDERAEKSLQLMRFLSNRQVDGFIIAPTEGSEEQINYLKEHNIPFVLIDRNFPSIPSNFVGINNYKAAHRAVTQLINSGNEKIGILAYSTSLNHMKQRVAGYRGALEDQGIPINEKWIKEIDFSQAKDQVTSAINEMLMGRERVKAIFFATNTLAVQGLKYIDELNYKVPKDVAIISFDEGEAFDFYYCPLSHIKQPLKEMGEKAVKLLIKNIDEPDMPHEEICLDEELVIRKSCNRE
ncbi:LacI family DNA-binding transcriptional regulator [Salegentibacter sp. F14]